MAQSILGGWSDLKQSAMGLEDREKVLVGVEAYLWAY
jgi:hypothetical protein